MVPHSRVLLALAAAAASCHVAPPLAEIPPTAREGVVETLHGVEVADPYRWMEDSEDARLEAWIDAQNDRTHRYLKGLSEVAGFEERLTTLWDYERISMPRKRGPRWVVSRNDGMQAQSVLMAMDSLDGEARVLFDPNALSEDGTKALAGTSFSKDGRYMAYGIADGGSDWNVWRIRDVEQGEDLPEQLDWIKFSRPAWLHDGSGFFYSRYEEPEGDALLEVNRAPRLCFHRLGTPQSEDEVVYERPDHPEWSFGARVTDDGSWLVLSIRQGTDPRNRVFLKSLQHPERPVEELVSDLVADFSMLLSDGDRFTFVTDLDAPRKRVVRIDRNHPEPAAWEELVPEGEETLEGVSVVGDTLIAEFLRDAQSVVRQYDLEGAFLRELELPGIGSVGGFGGDREDTETFFRFTSYTDPGGIYRLDVPTGEATLWRAPEVDLDEGAYTTEQVFVTSKDGTRVPMFLVHRKDVEPTGDVPTILYGYGGFNVSLTPGFSPSTIAWLDAGGLYAVANLRGGGEYGEEWHLAGTKLQKQNVFDDCIAAAEHLCASGWTSPEHLSLRGGSNGGLLVGAVLNQRPDLFGAAIPAVGVMDMLRYHMFTIGWAWASDYGTADDANEFRALLAYSPVHNVRTDAPYPPVLVTTAARDDRVVPLHSFKYAAALQHAQSGEAPILIRVEKRAGHGAGRPMHMLVRQAAEELGFLMAQLR